MKDNKIQSRVIIEILGKPKEHVEETMKKMVETIKGNEKYNVLETHFTELKEMEEMWGTFVELEIETKNVSVLIEFCFDYMPSSIEVIKPNKLEMTDKKISDMLNDLQARLHKVDMTTKQLSNENLFLKRNMRFLMKNFVTVLLFNSAKTAENLGKLAGMKKEEMEKFLDSLVEEKLLIKKEDRYTLTKNDQRKK